MGPDSLIELIGHARVQPDGTYTWQSDGWTSDVGLLIVSLSSRYTRYRYDNVALCYVMLLAIFISCGCNVSDNNVAINLLVKVILFTLQR